MAHYFRQSLNPYDKCATIELQNELDGRLWNKAKGRGAFRARRPLPAHKVCYFEATVLSFSYPEESPSADGQVWGRRPLTPITVHIGWTTRHAFLCADDTDEFTKPQFIGWNKRSYPLFECNRTDHSWSSPPSPKCTRWLTIHHDVHLDEPDDERKVHYDCDEDPYCSVLLATDRFQVDDVIGCLADLPNGVFRFYVNGVELVSRSVPQLNLDRKHQGLFFPTALFAVPTVMEFNFGERVFRFPPPLPFGQFNDIVGPDNYVHNENHQALFTLNPEDKTPEVIVDTTLESASLPTSPTPPKDSGEFPISVGNVRAQKLTPVLANTRFFGNQYFEVTVKNENEPEDCWAHIGWSTPEFLINDQKPYHRVGWDTDHSIGFDGRKLIELFGKPAALHSGDTIGCRWSLANNCFSFYLNGVEVVKVDNEHTAKLATQSLYPTASFQDGLSLKFNFGQRPFPVAFVDDYFDQYCVNREPLKLALSNHSVDLRLSVDGFSVEFYRLPTGDCPRPRQLAWAHEFSTEFEQMNTDRFRRNNDKNQWMTMHGFQNRRIEVPNNAAVRGSTTQKQDNSMSFTPEFCLPVNQATLSLPNTDEHASNIVTVEEKCTRRLYYEATVLLATGDDNWKDTINVGWVDLLGQNAKFHYCFPRSWKGIKLEDSNQRKPGLSDRNTRPPVEREPPAQVIGCLLTMHFTRNDPSSEWNVVNYEFNFREGTNQDNRRGSISVRCDQNSPLYFCPAVELCAGQRVYCNFGQEPFRYPPRCNFQDLNGVFHARSTASAPATPAMPAKPDRAEPPNWEHMR